MTWLIVGLVLGLAAGILLARRAAATSPTSRETSAPGVAPHLLPDPALHWLRRAHGALGVWVTELNPGEEGPRTERLVDAERLAVQQIVTIDRRLERARDQDQGGVERMEGGTLVFSADAGFAVGILLPGTPGPDGLALAEDDLRKLLDGTRRRPQIVALAQAGTQEASLESVGSVGLRLAYHLERVTGGPVLVAVAEEGGAVRVVGVSGRGDRRMLDTIAGLDSPLARVARGELGRVLWNGDPMGGVVADRRQHQPVMLYPLLMGDQAVGAVAIWVPGGEEPAGAAMAEVHEELANAAPRIFRGRKADALQFTATADPLTGLANRREFEKVLGRYDVQHGALVYCDLDKFKRLNDTLGHPAGDAAIVHFSRVIREQIRNADTAARMGGEEFAVWLPGAPLEVGLRIAERIRARLAETPWDWQGQAWPLTASFGVAACPETSRRVENLAGQADAALYVAKNAGRNRVAVAPVMDGTA